MQTKWRYGRRAAPLSPTQVLARQAQAGRTVAKARASSRDDALFAAVARLKARGEAPGQEAIAAEANVSLRTVKRAWPKLWDRIVNKVPYAPPTSVSSSTTTPEQPATRPVQPHAPVTEPAHPATCDHSKPAMVRLIGGHPGIDPRFLPPRARAAIAKWDRESWHREKAKGGSRSYGQACAARWRGLHSERLSHLADLQANLDRLVDRAETAAWPDLVGLAAAQDRLRLARLGWGSRLAAEERTEARTRAALAEQDGKPAPRFRTAPDGLDLFLGCLLPRRLSGSSPVNRAHSRK